MDLTKEINKILQDYAKDVDKAVLDAEDQVAKEAVKKLKATSPRNPRGKGRHYADDWKVDSKAKKNYAQTIIHNKQYQLTHLLENGHEVVRNGTVVGHAKPQPHIKAVEEWVKDEMVERIEKNL